MPVNVSIEVKLCLTAEDDFLENITFACFLNTNWQMYDIEMIRQLELLPQMNLLSMQMQNFAVMSFWKCPIADNADELMFDTFTRSSNIFNWTSLTLTCQCLFIHNRITFFEFFGYIFHSIEFLSFIARKSSTNFTKHICNIAVIFTIKSHNLYTFCNRVALYMYI